MIIPLAILLVLIPGSTAVYWMWAMRDPRSAILVGTVYAGATVYYVGAVRADDWLEAQAGLEGIFTVSAVLLLAVALHWDIVRPWHLMTLIWLPAYYVPLLFVPYLFRLNGGWGRLPTTEGATLSRSAAAWLMIRGIGYAVLAAVGFVFAGPLSRAWPWPIDTVELRMFFGQPATFMLSALALRRGNALWRRHRLALAYLASLGAVQLAGLLVLRSSYTWSSVLGVLLPLAFAEWILTPLLVVLASRMPRQRVVPRGEAVRPADRTARAVIHGVRIVAFTYLAIAAFGFLPVEAMNPLRAGGTARYLLRHFAVDTPHNLFHLALGVSGLWAARDLQGAQRWATVVGSVVLALFVAGLAQAGAQGFPVDQSLAGIALNPAGHVFHLATGILTMILGLHRPAR